MRIIGNDPSVPRQEHAVASGEITNAKPVIVNSNDTESTVGNVSVSAAAGTPVASITTRQRKDITFDSSNNKIVIVYADSSDGSGNARVGTVNASDNSITFGSEVEFESGDVSDSIAVTFDTNSNKVVIAYRDGGDNGKGKAIVGTVSGTSISFGSATEFEGGDTYSISAVFDSTNNKVVIAYADGGSSYRGKAIVGTVSSTSISFGSEETFSNGFINETNMAFDTTAGKVVIAYRNGSNSNYGEALVATVSGTSISYGSGAIYESAYSQFPSVVYDSVNSKTVIAYRDAGDGSKGTAVVGTISGTDITFGTAVVFDTGSTTGVTAVFDSNFNRVVVAYADGGNSGAATHISGAVSGTSITFDTEAVIHAVNSEFFSGAFDSNSNKAVFFYSNAAASNAATATVVQPTGSSPNLTSENYIGIANNGAADGAGVIIDTQGAIADNLSSLTAGQSYFVQTDGTIGTTADDPSVFAGTAVSATKLIVKG